MGTNMYPSSSLLGRDKDENEGLPVDELIEKADGFAGVFPGIYQEKYEISITISRPVLEKQYISEEKNNNIAVSALRYLLMEG